jgi:hypothetical protein
VGASLPSTLFHSQSYLKGAQAIIWKERLEAERSHDMDPNESRLLIIEENEEARRLLHDIFMCLGYEVEVTSNAVEACRRFDAPSAKGIDGAKSFLPTRF